MRLEEFSDVSEILRCGVYALVSKGKVIYVGKSRGMLGRVYTHRNLWIAKRKGRKVPDWLTPVRGIMFDEVHVLPCSLDRLDELEAQMIDKYKPKYNEMLKTQEKITAPITVKVCGRDLVLNAVALPKSLERRV